MKQIMGMAAIIAATTVGFMGLAISSVFA